MKKDINEFIATMIQRNLYKQMDEMKKQIEKDTENYLDTKLCASNQKMEKKLDGTKSDIHGYINNIIPKNLYTKMEDSKREAT